MVLSNKKLKRKLRASLTESLTSKELQDPKSKSNKSLKELLGSETQKPRLTKREKRRKVLPLQGTKKVEESNGGAQKEESNGSEVLIEKKKKKKRTREESNGDTKEKEEENKESEVLSEKKQKRKKKRKREETHGNTKEEEENKGSEVLSEKKEKRKKKRKKEEEGGSEVVKSAEEKPEKKIKLKKWKKIKAKEKKKKMRMNRKERKEREKEEKEKEKNKVGEDGNEEMKEVMQQEEVNESQESADVATKVYVGGIPYYSTEEDILSFFQGCGTITEVDCMTFPDTGKFRGIAMITFKTEDAAKRALKLDEADMGGLLLKIKPYKTARTQKSSDFAPKIVQGYNRVYLGNLSYDITEDDVRNLFSDCKISSIRFGEDKETGEFRGYAHVDFSDSLSLTNALKLDQEVVCGRPVKISCAVPKKQSENQSGSRNKKAENGSSTFNGEKKKRRTCYECGVAGHLSSACPKKKAVDLVDSSQK